jgi:hypothetical protein
MQLIIIIGSIVIGAIAIGVLLFMMAGKQMREYNAYF